MREVVKDGAALGHTGINNIAGERARVFAYSCGLNDELTHQFMGEVCNMFYTMVEDIFVATTKIIS